MSGVDVLAVMEGIVPNTRFSAFTGDDLDEARDALAELIEAVADVVERGTDSPVHMRLEAALANVIGGGA